MDIAIASDHAGFQYKETIKAFLAERGHEPVDFGTFSEDPADYPIFIRAAATAVAVRLCKRGIVLGGSGNGEAMVANRVAGVRCALCWSRESAEMARRHNDANVISIGQRMVTREVALDIVRTWLDTPFDGGRHARRIKQIYAASITTDAPDRVSPMSDNKITLTVYDSNDVLVDEQPVSISQIDGPGQIGNAMSETSNGVASFTYLASKEGRAVFLIRVNPATPSEVRELIEIDIVPEADPPWAQNLVEGWQNITWTGEDTPVADAALDSNVTAIYGRSKDGWSCYFTSGVDVVGANTLSDLTKGSKYFVFVAD